MKKFTAQKNQDDSIEAVFKNKEVVNFVKKVIKASYKEFFPQHLREINQMINHAFDLLIQSQEEGVDNQKLKSTVQLITTKFFKKGKPSFWFNKIYQNYKLNIRPEKDYRIIKDYILGKKILDFGSGAGCLSLKLQNKGYNVVTTDILDYRIRETKHLSFVKMSSTTDVSFPDDTFDTIIAKTVLHHVDSDDLLPILRRFQVVGKRLIIEEDIYDLPEKVEVLKKSIDSQPFLKEFSSMKITDRLQTLMLTDFFGTKIAWGSLGSPDINLPFGFKTIAEWENVLKKCGFHMIKVILTAYTEKSMHQNCQAWIICDRR